MQRSEYVERIYLTVSCCTSFDKKQKEFFFFLQSRDPNFSPCAPEANELGDFNAGARARFAEFVSENLEAVSRVLHCTHAFWRSLNHCKFETRIFCI